MTAVAAQDIKKCPGEYLLLRVSSFFPGRVLVVDRFAAPGSVLSGVRVSENDNSVLRFFFLQRHTYIMSYINHCFVFSLDEKLE